MTRQPTVFETEFDVAPSLYDWAGPKNLGFNVPTLSTNIVVFGKLPAGLRLQAIRLMSRGSVGSVECILQVGLFSEIAQAELFTSPVNLFILPPVDGDLFAFSVDDENSIMMDIPLYHRIQSGAAVVACQVSSLGGSSIGIVSMVQG